MPRRLRTGLVLGVTFDEIADRWRQPRPPTILLGTLASNHFITATPN